MTEAVFNEERRYKEREREKEDGEGEIGGKTEGYLANLNWSCGKF